MKTPPGGTGGCFERVLVGPTAVPPYPDAAIGLRRIPIPSISISQESPGFIQTGGFRAKPTPSGVPVTMMSPGSSVIASVRISTRVGTSKIMLAVFESCMVSPFNRVWMRSPAAPAGTDADGAEQVLVPGSVVTLPKGWSGRWDITETLRKAYVIIS